MYLMEFLDSQVCYIITRPERMHLLANVLSKKNNDGTKIF